MALAVKLTPEIQLGHLMQALILVASMSGWALWGYSAIETQISDDRKAIALMRQRQDQFDAAHKDIGADQKAFNSETRTSLKEIAAAIADLRTVVAAKR